MKLTLDIQPDLVALMKAEISAGERAVTAAMREAGTGLKLAWRGQIVGAGLGAWLANSIRSEAFPKAGVSLNAAALVWSKAPVIVGAHDAGPLIQSKNGFWLAIPTPTAGKALGGRRITPPAWERKTRLRLRFIYRRTGPSLLVADGAWISSRGLAAASRSKSGWSVPGTTASSAAGNLWNSSTASSIGRISSRSPTRPSVGAEIRASQTSSSIEDHSSRGETTIPSIELRNER